jgi:hypothetical protein
MADVDFPRTNKTLDHGQDVISMEIYRTLPLRMLQITGNLPFNPWADGFTDDPRMLKQRRIKKKIFLVLMLSKRPFFFFAIMIIS